MRILGIDIGSRSVKATLLESTFRSQKIVAFVEQLLPLSESPSSPDVISGALSSALFALKGSADRITTALPGDLVSHRVIELPFTDRRKIDQTILFELEDLVPFSLGEVAVDYIVASTEGKTSRIITTHIYKENLKNFIALFQRADIDPDLITTESHALFNLSLINFEIPVRTAAMLDIGHRRSTFCILHDNHMEIARTILCGGLNITTEISHAYRIPLEEAEGVKIERGFVLGEGVTDVTEEQVHFSNVIKNALSPLVREINQTLVAYRAKTKRAVDLVYLSGGTSLLRNIQTHLQEEWGVKIQPTRLFQLYPPGPGVPATYETEVRIASSLGDAIAALGQVRPYRINFRKGEFSARKTGVSSVARYKHIFVAGGIIALLISFDIGAKYFFLRQDLKKVQSKIGTLVKQIFPETPKHILAAPPRLKAYIDQQTSDQQVAIKELSETAAPGRRGIEVLGALSESLPGPEVKIDEMALAGKKVKVSGTAESIDAIESFARGLEQVKFFANVKKGEVATAADGINRVFSITFDVAD